MNSKDKGTNLPSLTNLSLLRRPSHIKFMGLIALFLRFMMSKDEVSQLRDGLKAKWESVNRVYQSITHVNKIDTVGLKRK